MDHRLFDARFHFPSSWLLSAPSQGGKTSWLLNLLRHWDRLFTQPLDYICWFYGQHHPLLDRIQAEFKDKIRMVEGLPDNLEDFIIPGRRGAIVLDDLMSEAFNSARVRDFYTKYVHHSSVCMFMSVHNIFASSRERLTILRNTSYLVIFKNHLDNSIVLHLARRILPKSPKTFVKIFDRCTSKAYGYLLVCAHPRDENENAKFRSDIFGQVQKCYTPL